jgi:hypothetical protein
MTTVLSVSVSDQKSLPELSLPANGEKDSGFSVLGFTFVGQYVDGSGYTVVVGQANTDLDASTCKVVNGNTGYFTAGSDGPFALLHTDNKNQTDYTVGETSDKDSLGGGVTFIAGGGGVGLAAK